ncbi:MAG TPA: PHB depolymerase family esterase [Myxococcota bacterium]|jgi:polyhydroxybutyrate depolymerase|nr:PHB depolymerase family esterase [Myxococcota bacterium]
MTKIDRRTLRTPRAPVTALGLAASLVLACGCDAAPDPAASGTPAPLTVGDNDVVIPSGGVDRTLLLYIPPSYDGHKPLPLVLVLHGFGGTGLAMSDTTGMSDKANDEGFFVAYLNGTACNPAAGDPGCRVEHPGQGWNSGLTPSLGITVDDVQFVRDVVTALETELRVDARRVYAAGFSNGAFMTHRLARELPDLLAAVALAEGTIGRDPEDDGSFLTLPDATGAIPILILHGERDTTVTYSGLPDAVIPGLCPCKSVDEAVAYWVEHDRCRGPSSSETDTGTDGPTTTTRYAGCFANNDVVLIDLAEGAHHWPSIGTDAAWDFFSKHSKTAD